MFMVCFWILIISKKNDIKPCSSLTTQAITQHKRSHITSDHSSQAITLPERLCRSVSRGRSLHPLSDRNLALLWKPCVLVPPDRLCGSGVRGRSLHPLSSRILALLRKRCTSVPVRPAVRERLRGRSLHPNSHRILALLRKPCKSHHPGNLALLRKPCISPPPRSVSARVCPPPWLASVS